MKSIKEQYNELTEGKISQQNFMRNLRMSLPQYVTSVTSFKDAIKILTNKGILNEAKKGHQLIDINSVDPVELSKGTKVEMEHTDDPKKAQKIALDHLAEDPAYYSKLALSGLNDPEFKSKKKTNDQHVEVTKKNLKDKVNAEKTPKGVIKDKASANKAKKETAKKVKVKTDTFKAKRAKGIKGVMAPTGEKTKTIKLKETLQEAPDHIDWDIISYEDACALKDYHDRTGRLPFGLTPEKWDEIKLKHNLDDLSNEPDEIDLYPGNMGDEMSAPNEGLNEDHLNTKEDQIKFILANTKYVNITPEDLASRSDDQIAKIYQTVEKIKADNAAKTGGNGVDLGNSFDKLKSKLQEIIKEVIDELNHE